MSKYAKCLWLKSKIAHLSDPPTAVQGRVAEARTEIQSKARLMGVQLVEAKLAGEGGGGGEEEALKG